jgi:hypothetical protein
MLVQEVGLSGGKAKISAGGKSTSGRQSKWRYEVWE